MTRVIALLVTLAALALLGGPLLLFVWSVVS
jgi:hypothetical protein